MAKFKGSEFIPKRTKIFATPGMNFELPNHSGVNQTIQSGREDLGWDDLRVPAQNTKLNPSKSEPAFESFIDGTFVFKFSDSNADDESVHFIAQLPHSYKEGSNLRPHIHWAPDSDGAGRVAWSFEYTIQNIGEVFPSTTTDVKDASTGSIENLHNICGFDEIDGSNLKISSIIVCRLTRKTTEITDTYTGNACFLEFDFHFQKNSMGSRQELEK